MNSVVNKNASRKLTLLGIVIAHAFPLHKSRQDIFTPSSRITHGIAPSAIGITPATRNARDILLTDVGVQALITSFEVFPLASYVEQILPAQPGKLNSMLF